MLGYLADLCTNHATERQLAWLYKNTPPQIFHDLANYRFRQTVKWAAKHSPFYRRAFEERSIRVSDIRTPQDLGDFFTTPDDLVQNAEEFVCRPPNIVFESSGTSGKNKRVYYGHDELTAMGTSMAAGFQLMGMTKQDRVANAFDFSIWIPGLITHYGLMAAGNFCLAFGKVDPIEVYRRLELHHFNVIMGEPTWLIRLTEIAEREGSFPLKLLIGGAEEMPAKAIPWMQEVWQGARVRMCYGSVEQGSALGFQPCEQADGYHLDTVDFLPEIIEPDADGYGEVVFTTLSRRTMPLIRYRSRDVAKLATARCLCGLRTPRLSRIRGRRDELVVASGGNLYPKMFENILRPIAGLTHDWRVVFRLEGYKEILEINVESSEGDSDALRDAIHAQASDQYPDLMKNLALGIFELRIHAHSPGSLRQTRKLKRLVDLRHHQPAQPLDDADLNSPQPIEEVVR